MSSKFFKESVARQFALISKEQLFSVKLDKEVLWGTYLNSFPAGTNPIYKTRTEHDCNCCKQFIRAIGDAVAIIDGKLVSVWDIDLQDSTYTPVAEALSSFVKQHSINNEFMYFQRTAGVNISHQNSDIGVITWDHLFANIPDRFVVSEDKQGQRRGATRARFDVGMRSLVSIPSDTVDVVIELIEQGSLYRGDEHMAALRAFKTTQEAFNKAENKELFVWLLNDYRACIRNTVIGSLLIDLSENVDLDRAVASFEAKVAPTNYKRPTALVTQKMVDSAKQKIEELGLVSALDRRYAVVTDIKASDILFVDKSSTALAKEDVFAGIANGESRRSAQVENVPIEIFVKDILPKATSIEVSMDSALIPNLVSLIAPCDPTALPLFKWDNNFSWSYNGEVADSIKDRVKKAGGNVSGDLCCRLAWFNYDDLDLHMIEPNGHEISFRNRNSRYTGGQLDVDMNAGVVGTREAVENIFYSNASQMQEGEYTLYVNNFNKRETVDVGFEVEIDFKGSVFKFAHPKAVNNRDSVIVAKFTYSHKNGIEFKSGLNHVGVSKEVWGVQTEKFQKVKMVMLSPNFWNGGVGNQHTFFILENCINPGDSRGFYNEFLRSNLDEHRKVFEVLASKTRVPYSQEQLSGIGISSTTRKNILVRVKGVFTRVINVTF